jgi:ATP phosphoribosyltransferase regulatory subunit
VESKDPAGVRQVLQAAGSVPPQVASALERLTVLGGGRETLDQAASALGFCPPARKALDELRGVTDALAAAGLDRHVAVDLAEVRGLDYYKGLVFRVFAPDLGFEVGGGGRYDALLARFGRPLPAVGFMLGLDRVALLLERQGRLALPARSAEAVRGGSLGEALARAVARRGEGVRVRFGNGEPR